MLAAPTPPNQGKFRVPSRPSGWVVSTNRCIDAAFTLVELLAVIAVIGILATLLIPGLTAARLATNKVRTRVQFNEWVAAVEGFRREYGYYPVLPNSGLVNPPGQSTDLGMLHLFHDVLAARRRDGSPLPAYPIGSDTMSPEAQNRKLIAFHSFTATELGDLASAVPGLLQDAFGQTEIAVLVDRDLDGVIRAGNDFSTLPAVGGMQPGRADFPPDGIRSGVIFYAPDPGATTQHPAFIFSWK